MTLFNNSSDIILRKQKYFEKILSPDGFLDTWFRYISLHELFTRDIWLNIPVYDLSELGIGLMFLIDPIELEPLTLLKLPEFPTDAELEQGIWINFEDFNFDIEFPEFKFVFDFVIGNFDFSFIFDFLRSLLLKAYFGVGKYGISVYDPTAFKEFIRSTMWKTRQLRYTDISFIKQIQILEEISGVHKEIDEVLMARIDFLKSAQKEVFILGLSPLGTGKFASRHDDYAIIFVYDANNNPAQVKVSKLEELIFGLYLGIIPLGFGCVMPKETVFNFENDKKMPSFFRFIDKKIKAFSHQFTLTPWAYRNYHRTDESLSYHKSARTSQYHSFEAIKMFIENLISTHIPPEEKDPVRIRQYINAILQLISYPAKRHLWGFNFYQIITEEEFYSFWLDHWFQQGLNSNTLEYLYEVIKPYLTRLREEKLSLGKKLMLERRNLAESLM